YLNERRVVTILVMAQSGLVGSDISSPIDLSYLADTVVLLRYFEAWGRVRKAISVVKKRTGSHEDTVREFRMTAGGMGGGEPLSQFHGVLSGQLVYVGEEGPLFSQAREGHDETVG